MPVGNGEAYGLDGCRTQNWHQRFGGSASEVERAGTMISQYRVVVDDKVVEFFSSRNKREREELLRIFRGLAKSPYQRGEWLQRTASGRELEVKRFGRWVLRYWLDGPVLELRVLDVEKIVP